MRKRMGFILLVLTVVLLSGCSSKNIQNTLTVRNGVLDLRKWNYRGTQDIRLDGSWEFYWKKFVTYRELPAEKPDLYAEVPNTWEQYRLHGKNLPGVGYATYRLHVITELPKDSQIGLLLNTFSSAYHLYINEKLITSGGKPSKDPKTEVGELKPKEVFFQIPDKEFDIIIQISNYEHARGGFWFTAYLGNTDSIQSLHDDKMSKELLLIGVMLINSVYCLYLYSVRPEAKYLLYFSITCLISIASLDTVGQFLITGLFPGISYRMVHFIWYASISCSVYMLMLFVHELFKSKVSKVVVRVYAVLLLLYMIVITFTETVFYSKLIYIYYFFGVLCEICNVIIVGIGIKNGCRDGWFNIISIIIMAFVYVHDNLYRNNFINCRHGEMIYLGLFLFIFIQMIIQSKRIKSFHDKAAATELAFLQAQIKPHFIYNSLNTFISISYYDIEKARQLLVCFADYLRKCFDIKTIDQFVPLKSELELAKTYLEIEKVRFEERLEVQFEEPEDTEIKVPILILQPIIENAVIHGILPKPEGGRIEVSIKNEEKRLVFRVKDNGVGMDLNKQEDSGKNKPENHVGLSNINSRLRKLYGKGLQIKSCPGDGTEVVWYIPANRKFHNK